MLGAAGLTEGALLRRVRGDQIGAALSDSAIALTIQRHMALDWLEGDFGGHSLRSSFITEGLRQGIALPALIAMTDHRSVAGVAGYSQGGRVAGNPGARLLGAGGVREDMLRGGSP